MSTKDEQKPFLAHQRGAQIYGGESNSSVAEYHSSAKVHETKRSWTPPVNDETVGWFCQILPQAIAAGTSSLLFVSIGMFSGYSTLAVAALTDVSQGGVHFTEEEVSWYGSLPMIFEPVGSIMVGWFLQSLGCKRLLVLVNVPAIACWLMVYYADSKPVFYIYSILSGLVGGLMEAPAIRYVSETSHPSMRSILQAYCVLSFFLGVMLESFLGSLMDWRQVALISPLVPIICSLLAFQVPETPMWLMSKGKPEAAQRSLQLLRGWAPAEMIKDEFEKLEFYGKEKNAKVIHGHGTDKDSESEAARLVTVEQTENNGVNGSTTGHWQDLTRREMLIPLSKCIILMALHGCGSVIVLQPYLLQIFKTMDLPVQINWATVCMTLMAITGIAICMCLIRRTRKKPLYILSMVTNALCFILLGIFTTDSAPTTVRGVFIIRWMPFILLTLLYFSHGLGRHPITTILIGEILPYRGRGIATGVAIGSLHIFLFVTMKFAPTVVQHLGLQSLFFIFAAITVAGVFFAHFYLPETEGRFLSDIETDITRDARGTSDCRG